MRETADDGVATAGKLFSLLTNDRNRLHSQKTTTIPAIRLFEKLPKSPMVTLPMAMELLDTTKPTASKAIELLRKAKVLHETTGKQRDRLYAYANYLNLITGDTE